MSADAEGPSLPTPRENPELIGQEAAEAVLLQAAKRGRLAHAWLLTGPRGIGKATLAYRFARYLLAQGESLRLRNRACSAHRNRKRAT